uniref:RxLR effector candidate protein n=1 Tax=Hyaloperonospora arabidopsidis (strain Emoy2) TaxID=559515 RepID=M4BP90_HYAAE
MPSTRLIMHTPRNYSRTKRQCYLERHQTYLRASERRSAACFRTRRGRSAGLGYESGGIACSICFATLWAQRNRWVHNYEETTTDQAKSEQMQTLLRQLQAVAVREHRFNRDGDDCIFFRRATELFFNPVSPRPFTQYDPRRQLTPR